MKVELSDLQKPVRKLRRALKTLPKNLPVEEVHDLRVQARRIEAIVATVMPGQKRSTRPLLKTMEAVRKAAGEVRDMDVLAGHVRALSRRCRDQSLAHLLEHLEELRAETAAEFLDTVSERRKDARHNLKRLSRKIGERFHGMNPRATIETSNGSAQEDTPDSLLSELKSWPVLNRDNLHEFRVAVKKLHYILQMAQDSDKDFVSALGKVKDRIGDWHDWRQLAKIAERVLHPQEDRGALKKIEGYETRKLQQALAAARAMRTRYLDSGALENTG